MNADFDMHGDQIRRLARPNERESFNGQAAMRAFDAQLQEQAEQRRAEREWARSASADEQLKLARGNWELYKEQQGFWGQEKSERDRAYEEYLRAERSARANGDHMSIQRFENARRRLDAFSKQAGR